MEYRYWDEQREKAPWPQRREEMQERFLATLGYAYQHSPAYHRLYQEAGVEVGDIKGLDELSLLPLLRMSDIVRLQEESPPFGGLETVAPKEVRRIYINPGRIMQPGEWDYRDTTWAQAMCGAGMGAGDRILNTFNYHLWPYAFMLDASAKMVGATVIPTGAGNTLLQVEAMRRLKVNAFLGTPSFLMTLTQRAEDMGLDPGRDLFLDKAMVGAEMLPESLRQRLQQRLGMSIRQAYGTVLLGCLGYECPEMQGLHVPEGVVVEIVDPATGKPVAPGAVGEVVASNFSRVYPMIRLATGDLSLFSDRPCPCGRSGPMLRKVLGRTDQAAKVRGTFVHPWQTDEVISRYPEVFKYQVVITRERDQDRMTFEVEPADDSVDPVRLALRIERDIKELLTIRGEVKVLPRGSIPDFHQKIQDRRSWD